MTRGLDVIAPVYVREKVIAPLAIAQKLFIDVIQAKLVVQSIETKEVIHGSFRGVIFCGSGFYQECPIARLRQ